MTSSHYDFDSHLENSVVITVEPKSFFKNLYFLYRTIYYEREKWKKKN